jgi:hypothetical protein
LFVFGFCDSFLLTAQVGLKLKILLPPPT